MNFGKWIVVAFALFAMFIGTLVAICVRQDITLVSNEYYNDELAYQDQITRISNTRSLADKPAVSKVSNRLEVSFPKSVEKAEVKLFCPSDPTMDRSATLEKLETRLSFDTSLLKSGMYRVKVFWSAYGKDYFLEEKIYIE